MLRLYLYARVRFCCAHLARETAGAACTRSSLRPPFKGRDIEMQTSGKPCRENAKLDPAVIASGAKQSIARHKERMDCFAALAMTGRERCPLESVAGWVERSDTHQCRPSVGGYHFAPPILRRRHEIAKPLFHARKLHRLSSPILQGCPAAEDFSTEPLGVFMHMH
jgi:hypothetical protein